MPVQYVHRPPPTAQATEEKNARVEAAARTASKMALADRLINGLAGENKRWSEAIVQFTQSYGTQARSTPVNARVNLTFDTGNLPGDVLMAVVFVCYAGPFTADFRAELLSQRWIPDLQARGIPCTQGAQPLDVLTTSAEKVLCHP